MDDGTITDIQSIAEQVALIGRRLKDIAAELNEVGELGIAAYIHSMGHDMIEKDAKHLNDIVNNLNASATTIGGT